jgi:S-formylglutathione hydrolase FrmB
MRRLRMRRLRFCGVAGAGVVLLLLALLTPTRGAAQGRVIVDSLYARTLVGNASGDTPTRPLTIYLPPSYGRDTARRYPVVYLLHGATSDPKEWLDGTYQEMNLAAALDARAAEGEYLVVMPLADNRFGGSFYVNSAAFGRWDDFVATELVHYVDTHYRTLPTRARRALVGQSMGGFGALSVAGRHPNVFGHVYAMSPCCLGLVGDLGADGERWRGAPRAYLRALAMALAPPVPLTASRADSLPPLPFREGTDGRLHPDSAVLRAWRAQLPLDRLARDARPYRRLCTIALEAGGQDALTNVTAGAAAFSEALTRAGIRHRYDVFAGGHVDRTRERFETAVLPWLSRVFAEPAARCRG